LLQLNNYLYDFTSHYEEILTVLQTLAQRQFAEAMVRRKLSALSSLFNYLCEKNAVAHNPVKGVKRPVANTNEGKTPALSNEQARRLLEAPPEDTLKGKHDQALLAAYLDSPGHGSELDGALFRPVKNNTTGDLSKPLNPRSMYRAVLGYMPGRSVWMTARIREKMGNSG
jgi:integrase/recombinase XerD